MLHALDDSLAIAGHRGLYVIGEAVNVNGICGGYNLPVVVVIGSSLDKEYIE